MASGLCYCGACYYAPELGRFLQADTVLDGLNRYAYCGNNPVNYVDPTGNWFDYSNTAQGRNEYHWRIESMTYKDGYCRVVKEVDTYNKNNSRNGGSENLPLYIPYKSGMDGNDSNDDLNKDKDPVNKEYHSDQQDKTEKSTGFNSSTFTLGNNGTNTVQLFTSTYSAYLLWEAKRLEDATLNWCRAEGVGMAGTIGPYFNNLNEPFQFNAWKAIKDSRGIWGKGKFYSKIGTALTAIGVGVMVVDTSLTFASGNINAGIAKGTKYLIVTVVGVGATTLLLPVIGPFAPVAGFLLGATAEFIIYKIYKATGIKDE